MSVGSDTSFNLSWKHSVLYVLFDDPEFPISPLLIAG